MHDVIIVGGGPTGFVTALGLAQAGVDVCLLEAEAGINDSPRACVYHWSMLDGLERLGIREEAERIGYTKDDYLWLVKKTGERLAYDLKVLSRITRFNYNIQLGQDRLAEICQRRLEAMANATIHWRTAFVGLAQDDQGVTVRADSPEGPVALRAKYVVGAASGPKSPSSVTWSSCTSLVRARLTRLLTVPTRTLQICAASS